MFNRCDDIRKDTRNGFTYSKEGTILAMAVSTLILSILIIYRYTRKDILELNKALFQDLKESDIKKNKRLLFGITVLVMVIVFSIILSPLYLK